MNIREARKSKGITQSELAQALGKSISVISRYETGAITPTQQILNEIADYLAIPKDSLEATPAPPIIQITDEASYAKPYYNDPNADRYLIDNNAELIQVLHSRAKSKCELCGEYAPFISPDGLPYLELHHLIPLLSGGTATPNNSVLLCANCHMQIHRLQQESDLAKLKKIVSQHT